MTAIEILGTLLRGRRGGNPQGAARESQQGGDILEDILGGGSNEAEEEEVRAEAPDEAPASQTRSSGKASGSVLDTWRREGFDPPAPPPQPAKPKPATVPAPVPTVPASQDRWKSSDSILRRPPPPAPVENDEDEAVHLIRAMINAARADGDMDKAEEQKILRHLGEPTPEVVNFIRNEFEKPLDVREFAWNIPLGLEAKVYSLSLAVMTMDSRAESSYLSELAHGLRMSPATCQQIHQRLGVPGPG